MRYTSEEHVMSCHEGEVYHQGHSKNINHLRETPNGQNSQSNGLDRGLQLRTFEVKGHADKTQVYEIKQERVDANSFQEKLYVYSDLEFDLATMLQFLKSFGAIGIEPASNCDRISKALVHFNTKSDGESYFEAQLTSFSGKSFCHLAFQVLPPFPAQINVFSHFGLPTH
ncbi:hypothetical protein DSO57_1038429 [Entomophthora muscae]|uniref:Uncharacterized protein n=1 Tax=Entomophthora muscae TaxID=34485 RepID=A0ACC2S0Y2_9FUNG|nr:hypothetical protein DSO57_1038429 [Entomophthora muscae]